MIEARGLRKSFGSLKAVDDVTFTANPGEIFCFLGPNGAGKTTTLKMLCGLMRPDAGEARIDGLDIRRQPVEARRRLGYIPDTPFLYERLTPLEYIEFVADLYGMPPASRQSAVRDAFELFGLESHAAALIGELSHGMRQRLLYVATFLHEPSVVLVDEPLVGLDPYTIRLIKDLLVAKARAGMTVFLTTHILAVAEEIGDRIAVLAHGRIAAMGTLDDVKRSAGASGGLEEAFLKLTRAPARAARPGPGDAAT